MLSSSTMPTPSESRRYWILLIAASVIVAFILLGTVLASLLDLYMNCSEMFIALPLTVGSAILVVLTVFFCRHVRQRLYERFPVEGRVLSKQPLRDWGSGALVYEVVVEYQMAACLGQSRSYQVLPHEDTQTAGSTYEIQQSSKGLHVPKAVYDKTEIGSKLDLVCYANDPNSVFYQQEEEESWKRLLILGGVLIVFDGLIYPGVYLPYLEFFSDESPNKDAGWHVVASYVICSVAAAAILFAATMFGVDPVRRGNCKRSLLRVIQSARGY